METNINSLWINKIGDRIVGLARLVPHGPHEARLVFFHIDPEWQHTKVPENLIRSIYNYCQDHGGIRVILASQVAPPWMLALLKQYGFRCTKPGKTPKTFLVANF